MTELTLSSMPFSEASAFWLEQHKRYIKHNTEKNYRAAIKLLSANLGDVLVRDIHIGHIRAYQAERSKKAGPYLLNCEISVLPDDLARSSMLETPCGSLQAHEGAQETRRP